MAVTAAPSTSLYPSLQLGQTGQTGSVGFRVLKSSDGSTVLARTTTNIVEQPATSGLYVYRPGTPWTTPATPGEYELVWDLSNTAPFYLEDLLVVATTITPPANAGGNSAIAAPFWIKRNDTREPITYQATEDGAAVDISGATVRFNMRSAIDTGVAKVSRAAATIVDGPSGQMKYQWIAVDTDTTGQYFAEFEVTFSDGRVKTFPTTTDVANEYILVHVISDLA